MKVRAVQTKLEALHMFLFSSLLFVFSPDPGSNSSESRQIAKMEHLIKNCISGPFDKDEFWCKPDTAASVAADGHVSVAHLIQAFHNAHAKTFCECEKDWRSK
jgi:hypothetical protein